MAHTSIQLHDKDDQKGVVDAPYPHSPKLLRKAIEVFVKNSLLFDATSGFFQGQKRDPITWKTSIVLNLVPAYLCLSTAK